MVTGSSSFDLRSQMSETLLARCIDDRLYPFALGEVLQVAGLGEDLALRKPASDALLTDLMLYELYYEIYLEANPATKQLLLSRLVESYLFKDILAFQRLRYSQTIVDLARPGNPDRQTEQ